MGRPRASARSEPSEDIRDAIFRTAPDRRFTARLWSREAGVVAGIGRMKKAAEEIGLTIRTGLRDGDRIEAGGTIAEIEGTPKQISLAEDSLIGSIAKTSGIATAARKAVELAGERTLVVSGGWKKMPLQIKEEIREALRAGGAGQRICNEPFVYLDKNSVRIFGGVGQALRAVRNMRGRIKVVQIRGETAEIGVEAVEAAWSGAGIVMVDSGRKEDAARASVALEEEGLREGVKIAFGGSVRVEDIPQLAVIDVDILDIGRALIDAPMLDVRLDVS